MSEAPVGLSSPLDQLLDAVRPAAFILEWPLERERNEQVCAELARLVDALIVCVARGRGALEVAFGEGLDALSVGDRLLQLGYTNVGDYARERFGIAASTAVKMARFAKALRARPSLQAAVRSGEVSTRKAEAVLPVAVGDVEEVWVARTKAGTVRQLKAAVKEQRAPEPQEQKWGRIGIPVPAEGRPAYEEAMELGRKLLGANASKQELLGAVAQEYLSVHWPGEPVAEEPVAAPAEDLMEPLKQWLERENAQWAWLTQVQPVPAPELERSHDPRFFDAELRRLYRQRERWDELFGHLALLVVVLRVWRRLEFASFEHYCEERLGMGERTVAQRAALERRLHELPALREAMRKGRVSYEKARLLSHHVDAASVGPWIERAERMTCVQLRRALEEDFEAQVCADGGGVGVVAVVPSEVRALLALAFRAVRKTEGRSLSPGECLWKMCAHFVEVWKPILDGRSTLPRRILERDRGLCQVPGCSRAAAQTHHLVFRSQGGSDEEVNLVSLCTAHHLQSVHMGWLRVWGKAPDGLRWQLGVRAGLAPLIDFAPGNPDAAFAWARLDGRG